MKDNTPIYPYSVIYAKENFELLAYRESHKAHVACRDAIDAAISKHYRNNTLDGVAVKEVAEQFGYDRMLYVLANTIRHKDWDGRFSSDNRQWAKAFPITADINSMGDDRTMEFIANSHPGLLDIFARKTRQEYSLAEPERPHSVIDQLQAIKAAAPAQEISSPKKQHNTER